MKHVVFVAPFFMTQTVRFLASAASEPGARVSLVHQDGLERLAPRVRERLVASRRVRDVFDPASLVEAVGALATETGAPPARLLGILENLQETLAEARVRLGLPGIDPPTARLFRDKGAMKDRLRSRGVPCAAAVEVRSADAAVAAARDLGFPLVAKPPAGAGAKQTFRLPDAGALEDALRQWPPSAGNPWLLEEFVRGTEHSFDSVSLGGRVRWHSISRYLPGPLEVVERPWIQWCVILPRAIDGPEYAGIREAGPAALDALGAPDGLSHMEWFLRPDGRVAISEVGARPPGARFTSLLSWAHDADFHRVWARLSIHDAFEPPERKFAVGAVYLRGMGSGPVVGIRGLDRAQAEVGRWVVESHLPRPGQAAAGGYEGDGTVIVRHPDTGAVEEICATIMKTLRVERAENAR